MPTFSNAAILFLLGLAAFFLPAAGGGETAIVAASWVLALVFGRAALIKLAHFPRWRATLLAHALPRPLQILALPIVPVAEAAVPVLALSGQARLSSALAVALLIVFSAAVIHGRIRQGEKLPCGCFGKRRVGDYRAMLLRNLGLGMTAAIVLAGKPGGPLLSGLRGPHLGEAIPALLLLLGLALGVSAVAEILRLRRFLRAARTDVLTGR